jgi:hypothetical protein
MVAVAAKQRRYHPGVPDWTITEAAASLDNHRVRLPSSSFLGVVRLLSSPETITSSHPTSIRSVQSTSAQYNQVLTQIHSFLAHVVQYTTEGFRM